MLFAIDDPKQKFEIPSRSYNLLDPNGGSFENESYKFNGTKHATEEEMFAYFKKQLFIAESISSLRIDTYRAKAAKANGSPSRIVNDRQHHKFHHTGVYIVPKLFGYFPFLDCDNMATYEDAKFHLNMDF